MAHSIQIESANSQGLIPVNAWNDCLKTLTLIHNLLNSMNAPLNKLIWQT